jgi:hypothetical protein
MTGFYVPVLTAALGDAVRAPDGPAAAPRP